MSDITATAAKDLPTPKIGFAALAALVLMAAGDVLLHHARVGLNLFVLFILALGAVLLLNRSRAMRPDVLVALAVAFAGAVPLLEAPSFWGFLTALFGASILALAITDRMAQSFSDLSVLLVRFGLPASVRVIDDGFRLLTGIRTQGRAGRLISTGLTWIVPAIMAAIFIALFVIANPVIETVVKAINLDALFKRVDAQHVVIWVGVLSLTWPLLRPQLITWPADRQQGPAQPRTESVIFGAAAIARSLIVFNLLFAVQSVMDIDYLWNGVRLPVGMSHADYAHRGAYPLIISALLAGAFILAAMRRNGAGEKSPFIRILVYVFIAQNVLLVISSILRLELYVRAYSLTELRVAAFVWMGLVAAGLVLILLRVALRKSNAWLVAMNLGALGLTIYAAAFVDVPALVARFNVDNSYEISGEGMRLDFLYLAGLGPGAPPALDDFMDMAGSRISAGDLQTIRELRDAARRSAAETPPDWRSWTWREARLRAHLYTPLDTPLASSAQATIR